MPSADTADAVDGFIGGLVSVHTTAQRCERWPGAADSVVRAPCRRIQFSSSSASASAAFDNDSSASIALTLSQSRIALFATPIASSNATLADQQGRRLAP